MRRVGDSFKIDANRGSASGRCDCRSADGLRWRLFLGIDCVGLDGVWLDFIGLDFIGLDFIGLDVLGIDFIRVHVLRFRRDLDRFGRVLLQ